MPPKTKKLRTSSSPLEKFREVFTELNPPKGGLPTMPTKISEVSIDQLGDMIARYSAWREFTEDRHTEALYVLSETKSKYDLAFDSELLSVTGSTLVEKKAAVKSSKQVVRLSEDLLSAEQYVSLLGGKLDSFTNVLSMLSRELTRRGVYRD